MTTATDREEALRQARLAFGLPASKRRRVMCEEPIEKLRPGQNSPWNRDCRNPASHQVRGRLIPSFYRRVCYMHSLRYRARPAAFEVLPLEDGV